MKTIITATDTDSEIPNRFRPKNKEVLIRINAATVTAGDCEMQPQTVTSN